MDSDSKLDLDDCAAGHPIALCELNALRAVVRAAQRVIDIGMDLGDRGEELSAALAALDQGRGA